MGAAARTRSLSASYAYATPTVLRGPPRAEPPAALRILASRTQFGHPRPGPISDLYTDETVPRADSDRDRPARSA
jgi:hypothetical protein